MIRRTSELTRTGMVWALALAGSALGPQTVVIRGGTLIDGAVASPGECGKDQPDDVYR